MSKLTQIEGVPDSESIKPGMAFFCGTGPSDKTCGDCKFRGYYRESRAGKWNAELQQIVHRSYRVQKCEMTRRMSGGKHGADVDADNLCCKYFEPEPAKQQAADS